MFGMDIAKRKVSKGNNKAWGRDSKRYRGS